MVSKKRAAVNPALRRKGRERAVQFLFGLEYTKSDWDEAIIGFWDSTPTKESVQEYARFLVEGVVTNMESLDATIDEAIRNWSPDRVGHIERNILRVAAFEIAHCDDVPSTVAINEAIEVAKRFGTDEAPRFVNGVLDRLKGE
jgi:N utilization substance protein B